MSQMQKTIERVSRAFSRREFVAGAGAAAGLALVSRPVFGQQAAAFNGPKIKIGIVGCGGRGSFMANLFRQHGGYEIAAAADYFQDRVDVLGEKFGVPAGRRFAGLSGYQRVLDAYQVDYIVVGSYELSYLQPDMRTLYDTYEVVYEDDSRDYVVFRVPDKAASGA